MADVGEVRYKAVVDDSEVEKDINKVEGKIEKGGKSAGAQFAKGFKTGIDPTKATNSKVADAVTDKWKTASAVVGASFAAMTAGAVAFGVKSIGLASDLNEVQNVVDTTFGGSADKINKWAKTAGESFGLSELAAKQYTSTMGAMLKSMGMSEDATTDMSIALAGLAGDMASFYNLDAADAFEKLRSGISGETEPLKELGINMSVANLEAFALSEGITTAYDSMTQAEQATLRYQYIMQATADAQGDFSDTSDSLANQQRILQMEVETLSADLGQALLPAALGVVEGLRSLVEWASQNQTALTVLAVAFAGITAAIIAYSASLTLAASGMTIATAAGAAFGAVVGFLTSPITLVIAAITALVAAGVLLYQNWDTVSAWAASAWESIKQSISSAIEAVSAFISNLAASASAKMSAVRDAIVNGFNSAVEFITSLPGRARQWGADFVQGLIDGITSMARKVGDAAKGLADKIAGFLHFSRPDVGPLREYENWMPDMVRGLAAGIRENVPELESAAGSMAGKVSGKIKRGIADAAQWADFATGIDVPGPLSPGLSWPSLTGRLDAAGVFPHDSARMEGLRQAITITPVTAKPGGAVIQVPISIDGREVARATAWYMGEELAWEER